MAPATPTSSSRFVILVVAELCLLATWAYSTTPPTRPLVHSSSPSAHTKTRKHTWHNGPASMPPDTEILGSHPPLVPPRVRDLPLSSQGEQKGGAEPQGKPSTAPTLAATRTPAAPLKPEVTPNSELRQDVGCVAPQKSALGEMDCLRAHPDARQAFYDDLRRTVDQVRAGERDDNEKKPFTQRP